MMMEQPTKPNLFKQILERKAAAQKARHGVLANSDLARNFSVGEKPQPILRRGGRNGSGKP